ncbi:MAG: Hsp20/alpha crystallin family protein [Chitinophagaceae bacterium]|nr:Hsp20/alpha crystallin family protein [Chitinophagaceae bacterium]
MALVNFSTRPSLNNFDNLFNEFITNFPSHWSKAATEADRFTPKANVHETKEAFHLELIVPGRAKEDFKVAVENGLLIISADKKEAANNEDYKTLRREFSLQAFKSTFYVDESVQTDAIQARYENGILKFLLPKKENEAPASKQITIQ